MIIKNLILNDKYKVFFMKILKLIFFDRFETAKSKINQKYDEIECSLICEFEKAHRANDRESMKEISSILSHFKGYSQCITVYIEEAVMVC